MAWDKEPIAKVDREIDKVQKELHFCDLAVVLQDDEVFNEWFAERFTRVAESLSLVAIRRPKSNADRNAASGILRFVESKKAELAKYASRKYREELTKRLEVLYAERKRRGDKSRGRDPDTQLPYGTF